MKKKILSAIMAVVLTASFCACGKSGNDDNTITMATNAEFPPYEYHDNNKIVGIDAEIAEAIANKLGYKLEIEDIAFDSIIPELSSKKADFGMAGMTVTEDRKKSVDFSDSYASARQSIIVPENSSISGPDDLKDKIVGVQTATSAYDMLQDSKKDLADTFGELRVYETYTIAYNDLKAGAIDAIAIDMTAGSFLIADDNI